MKQDVSQYNESVFDDYMHGERDDVHRYFSFELQSHKDVWSLLRGYAGDSNRISDAQNNVMCLRSMGCSWQDILNLMIYEDFSFMSKFQEEYYDEIIGCIDVI